jgi:tocopherol O-methyltransferase
MSLNEADCASASDRHVERLRAYYEDSWFDYRFLWLDRTTRALHFGYEQPGERSHAASLLALNHVMAEHVRLRRGERVLDAGCGVGGTSMWLAEQYGAEVVGINLVDDHVERARRYARERGLGQAVRFERADYTATGFDAASFDVVWAQESACHAPDKTTFAQEAARLLRPGGRLVMAEYILQPGPPEPDVAAWEEGWEMTLADRLGWETALGSAGLVDVEFDDITDKVRRSLRRLDRLCKGLRPVASVLHKVGIRSDAQQRNIAGSLAMGRALAAQRWFYAIVTAQRPATQEGNSA